MFRSTMRVLLGLASPADRRDMVVGDLEEEWADRIRPRLGAMRAELWYVRECLSLVFAFQRDRLRGLWHRFMRRNLTVGHGQMTRNPRSRGWFQDFGHTVRGLRRVPSFAVVAVLTLAIGIGGTVTMFTLVHAAYLRPRAYPEAERLVRVFTGYQNDLEGRNSIAALTWQDAQERPDLLEAAEVWESRSYHLSDEGTVRRIEAARVSAGLLPLMGATPTLGRLFVQDEAVPGGDRSVILSHGMWVESFGGDSSVIGRTVVLDDSSYHVVGVMNTGFDVPRGVDLWVPLALGPVWYTPQRRGWEFLDAVARLRDGVTPSIAADGLTEQLAREAPDRVERVGQRVNVVPLREHLVGNTGDVILILLGAVSLVLLIGCANVMNLVLARAENRRREFALRRALGASVGRLARLVVLETVVLSGTGGILGLAAALGVLQIVSNAPPDAIVALGDLPISWPILGFAFVLSIGTGLLFGLVPVIGALGSRPSELLRTSIARAGGSISGNRIRAGLIVGEVALAVVLVFGVGITGESLRRLTAVSPGFEPGNALAVTLETPSAGYDRTAQGDVYRRILERVSALPGVSRAALTYALPLTGIQWSASFELVEPDPSVPEAAFGGNMRPVSPGFFRTMGVPLVEGRLLEDFDTPGAPPVVVVDETLARRGWPNRSPVGEQIDLGVFLGGERQATIVGVVGDVRDRGLDLPSSGHVYFTSWQSPQRRMILIAQPAREGLELAPAIRAAVAEVEPRMPVYDVRSVTSVLSESLASRRLSLLLLGSLAVAALLLAAIGVYGVLSYTVALRIREIGTRIAIGATPSGVVSLILRQVAVLWLVGGVAGGIIALGARTVIRGLVFDVNPGNPAILGAAIVGLVVVAMVAGIIPARRASRVDCVEALRQD